MVFVTDDADRVAIGSELRRGLLALDDPGACGVDDLDVVLAAHLLELVTRDAVGADDQRAAFDLVSQIGRSNAPVRQIGLDARVVDELPQGGDVLALVPGVFRLVDRQPHAVAEAGAFRDAHLGTNGGCRAHLEFILSAPALAFRTPPWPIRAPSV